MPDIFTLASWVGGIAFAVSGYLIGARKDMDIMGIFILSMLTANGGGVLRDVLIGRTPAVLTDVSAFLMVLGVIMLATLCKLYRFANLEKNRLFVLCDSVGLAAFSVTGALVGIEYGLSVFGVMVLAFLTATGGGIIRDLLVNEVPAVLNSDFYGTIAILMGAILYGIHIFFPADEPIAVAMTFSVALLLRLVAWRYQWRLPRLNMH